MSKTQSNGDAMDRLISVFNEVFPESNEEIDAELDAAGFSPSEVGEFFGSVAARALRQSPHDWRNRSQTEPDDDTKRQARISRLLEMPVARLQKLFKDLAEQHQVATAHRNLEGMSANDLASALADMEAVLELNLDDEL